MSHLTVQTLLSFLPEERQGSVKRRRIILRLPEHARRPQGPVQTLNVRTETLLVACKILLKERKEIFASRRSFDLSALVAGMTGQKSWYQWPNVNPIRYMCCCSCTFTHHIQYLLYNLTHFKDSRIQSWLQKERLSLTPTQYACLFRVLVYHNGSQPFNQ